MYTTVQSTIVWLFFYPIFSRLAHSLSAERGRGGGGDAIDGQTAGGEGGERIAGGDGPHLPARESRGAIPQQGRTAAAARDGKWGRTCLAVLRVVLVMSPARTTNKTLKRLTKGTDTAWLFPPTRRAGCCPTDTAGSCPPDTATAQLVHGMSDHPQRPPTTLGQGQATKAPPCTSMYRTVGHPPRPLILTRQSADRSDEKHTLTPRVPIPHAGRHSAGRGHTAPTPSPPVRGSAPSVGGLLLRLRLRLLLLEILQ